MKKLIFGTAMAALAMFSACESLGPQDITVSKPVSDANSEKVVLTASIGVDTKTYLEQISDDIFKLRWAEGDEIVLYDWDVDYTKVDDPDDYMGYFELSKGAGESTAEFVLDDGYMPNKYLAVYAEIWPEETTGQWMFWSPRSQYRNVYENKDGEAIQGFDYWDFPMYAIGSGTNLQFKNLCSVLKLSVTGNGETLTRVRVSSMDEGIYLSGDARINFEGERATFELIPEDIGEYKVDVYDYVTFNPEYESRDENGDYEEHPAVLSADPVECYIVLPPQTYPSGLKITLYTDDGYMEVTTDENLKFEASELREIPVFEYEGNVSYADKWLVTSYSSYVTPAVLDEEGGYLVVKNYYMDYNDYYIRDPYGNLYGWSYEYDSYTSHLTNTCGQLELGGQYISIQMPGYYDLYLDVDKKQLFIMNAGIQLSDIPTLDNVYCADYYRLREMMYEEPLVKVYGEVLACCSRGFVMRLGWSSPIMVYTYDSKALPAEMKAELDGVKPGDRVELYATNKEYFSGLPELYNVIWSKVHKTNYYEVYYNNPYIITGCYYSEYYDYIGVTGTLTKSGSRHYVAINGQSESLSYIFFPTQTDELDAYVNKKVVVHGYYIGTEYSVVNMVITKILLPEIDSPTEDVIPDDDIVVPVR